MFLSNNPLSGDINSSNLPCLINTIIHEHSCTHVRSSMYIRNRGSYMSAHVLLNLLNKLGKRDKMQGNEFDKFNNTRA